MKRYSWWSNPNITAIRSILMKWEEYLIGKREVKITAKY
jgi:hypothetical protein